MIMRLSVLLILLISFDGLCPGQASRRKFEDWENLVTDGWASIDQCVDLTANEREGLIDAIAAELRPEMSQFGIKSERDVRNEAAQTLIRSVDLSGKGSKEFLAQGVGQFQCSPTGNCSAWIFRRRGHSYSAILNRGAVHGFAILPSFTNGIRDIVLHQHGSATSFEMKLFRFTGSAYRQAPCYNADFRVLGPDGEVHQLENPRMTPCQRR